MRRTFAILGLLVPFILLSCQSTNQVTSPDEIVYEQTVVPENPHTTVKAAKVQYSFNSDGNVKVEYTCLAVVYAQESAMNTVLGVLQDFLKENNYHSYTYLKKDSVKYFSDNKKMKWATYTTVVKFK